MGSAVEQNKHSFKDTLKENLALAVYNTGYECCTSGHKWGPALRDHYLIHYIRSGKGTYTFGETTYHLQAGDMFLVFPSTLVSYMADVAEPWEYYWVGFNGTEANRLLQETGFSKKQPVFHFETEGVLPELLMNIYRSSGSTPACDADMVGYLYLFFGELIRRSGQGQVSFGMQEYVTQALRYIEHNYADNMQVGRIADYVGVSRSQLYRAFMENLGLSPHSYLKRYRVNQACALLQHLSLTVSEVAGSTGFSDPLYFSRVFREVKGITPSEYQRRYRRKE